MLGINNKYHISGNTIFYGKYNHINYYKFSHFYSILNKEQLFRFLIIVIWG